MTARRFGPPDVDALAEPDTVRSTRPSLGETRGRSATPGVPVLPRPNGSTGFIRIDAVRPGFVDRVPESPDLRSGVPCRRARHRVARNACTVSAGARRCASASAPAAGPNAGGRRALRRIRPAATGVTIPPTVA